VSWEDNRNETRGVDVFFGKSGWIIMAAPELSDDSFTPKLAQADTEFHFTAVYTDFEDDPPAVGYPKLHLFKDDAGTDPFTGSPFMMNRQMAPAQDDLYSNGMIFEKRITLSEAHNYSYYITTKALTGNITTISSNLTQGPRLDLSPVVLSNALPMGLEWHDNVRVNCSISVRDQGFAGVDPISVYYRTSIDGTTNFDEWTNKGMNYYITPEWVNVSANIYFDDGIDNYIQWKASDKYGNGPVETEFYRINIDTTSVVFSEAYPDPSINYWYNTEKIEVGISVTDTLGSGVNASSIEYAISTSGVENYGDWQSANASIDSEKVVVRTHVTFVNGTENYLRWRAEDALGNGPNQTGDYHFRVDTTLNMPTVNHPPTPPINIKPSSTMDRTPYITWEAGTDEDKDSLFYFIQIGTSMNGSDVLPWKNQGEKLGYQIGKNLNVGTHYIHLKSYDGRDYSEMAVGEMEITLEGNTPPEPPESLTPLYTSEKRPNFEWPEAFDAEDDLITYYIQIGTTPGGEETLPLTWLGYGTSYDYNQAPLANGIYYVRIFAYDSKDWSEPGEFVVKIANYAPGITSVSPISIPQGESRTITVNVTNTGSGDDTVMLNYSKVLDGIANLTFSDNDLALTTGAERSVNLKIAAPPSAKTGDYYLILTATSEDGTTTASFTVIVTITDSQIGPPPNGNGNGKNGDGDDDNGIGTTDFSSWLAGMFFWFVLLMIIFVVIIFVYLGMRGKKGKKEDEEEQARARDDYDEVYSREGDYPPPPPEGDYDPYAGGVPPAEGDWGGEGMPPPQGEQYQDYYGTQYDGTVRPAQQATEYDQVPQAQQPQYPEDQYQGQASLPPPEQPPVEQYPSEEPQVVEMPEAAPEIKPKDSK
jgi:hypothetical protein